MKVDLSKYKKDWYKEDPARQIYPGPVITISRELGCPAKKIARELAGHLNGIKQKRGKDHPWQCISKEILHESARALKVDSDQIEHIFKYEQRNALEDLLFAQSKNYYQSDLKIRKTIARVIRGIANNGNAIIVGRGGVAITRDIPKSLHIMLEAPLEWRAVRTATKHDMTLEQARNYTVSIDKKRKQFRDYFQGKGNDYTRFDIKLNCMTMETHVIVKIILGAMKAREFIWLPEN